MSSSLDCLTEWGRTKMMGAYSMNRRNILFIYRKNLPIYAKVVEPSQIQIHCCRRCVETANSQDTYQEYNIFKASAPSICDHWHYIIKHGTPNSKQQLQLQLHSR